ncbi:hypothetical protein [Halorientalis regularis]|jgi:hypothetical protein|uniref:Uncharacterized protein n=1 Tax=Halorientalis regularis TaxID=660518 RepID=A0A1G7GRU8_9EURY|nr:hypothetical protein [Halorientalis regularis]SDE90898.1 hypothetical protein SAMN05216218_102160 [Halorientalis regularis]
MYDDFRQRMGDTYEEYELGSVTVAMISDSENEHAWIQSDRTCPVEP